MSKARKLKTSAVINNAARKIRVTTIHSRSGRPRCHTSGIHPISLDSGRRPQVDVDFSLDVSLDDFSGPSTEDPDRSASFADGMDSSDVLPSLEPPPEFPSSDVDDASPQEFPSSDVDNEPPPVPLDAIIEEILPPPKPKRIRVCPA